jgi:MFS family permease
MIFIGLSNPLYQVGADAMLADMIPSEKRTDAYAINRIANNAAFAMGPAVGGFLASTSYNLAFYGASAGFLIYSLLLFFLARETLDKTISETKVISLAEQAQGAEGYARVFRDKGYMAFVSLVAMGLIAPPCCGSSCLFTQKQISISPRQCMADPTTNAIMRLHSIFRHASQRGMTLPVAAAGMLHLRAQHGQWR